MAEEKNGKGYGFWALVLSGVIGSAAGYIIAHYVTNRKWNSEGYIDRAIKFLEDMKSKSQRGYDQN
jgi:uncharacterized membrane-anchored protein